MRTVVLGIAVLCALVAGSAASPRKPARAAVFVTLPNAGLDPSESTAHINAIRRLTLEALAHTSLDARQVDVTIAALRVRLVGNAAEISAQLRVVVSTGEGQIQSFATGSAKLTVSRRELHRLPALRRQALESAMDGVKRRLLVRRPVA